MNESQRTQAHIPANDEIDLRDLFRILWAGKWLIGGITFAVTVTAVIMSLILPNVYRAEALLAPNHQEGAGGLSALAAQYGGLASLAGISLGGGKADKTAVGLEILKSRKFITNFIQEHDILVPLMATSGWNSETEDLKIDSRLYDISSNKWIRDVSPPKKTVPSNLEAYEEFMEIMSVGQDKKTGFISLSVEHYSPLVAKQWVDWLSADINLAIMRQEVAEAEQAISYLNDQISNTSLADLQSVFFNLIEEQTKIVMLAKVTDEYLFKTLDPAVVPEVKFRPRRSLIVIISALLALTFGVVIVLISASFRRANTG